MAAFSIYLINLDRSTDRLAAMRRQLLALGLTYQDFAPLMPAPVGTRWPLQLILLRLKKTLAAM